MKYPAKEKQLRQRVLKPLQVMLVSIQYLSEYALEMLAGQVLIHNLVN